MKIEHISVSRKECFDECWTKYRFRYHEKLPSPFPEPPYFAYGKTVHKIAEVYVQKQAEMPINEVTKLILSGKIPIEERFGKVTFAPHLSPEYRDRLPEHLRSIERLVKLMGTKGLTEFPFEYDLDPPNRCLVNGVIDRLIENKNKYWIIDYKTTKPGKWRKTPQTITNDVQLRCYARFVQRQYNVPAENIQAALFYLEKGGDTNLVGARFSNESLIGVEQELLKTYRQIENMTPQEARGRVGEHCRRCDYRGLCPYFKPRGK